MNPSKPLESASDASKPSSHLRSSNDDTTPGRYTCYDIGTFLSLYIVLATTSTVDVASDAFEQGENVSKAHDKIEITDAHADLARRSGRKVRPGASGDQAGEKVKKVNMVSRIGNLLKKIHLRDEE